MPAMTLSAKRQVVLPAELCRAMDLQPGSSVEVSLAEDGKGILIKRSFWPGRSSRQAGDD